jgi:hypothetical protein
MMILKFAVALASVALAAPSVSLDRRQFDLAPSLNELTKGTSCRANTMIYARGAVERGNIVRFTVLATLPTS